MINTTAMALISSVYPPQKRGFSIGIGTAAVYTGMSCGPFLGGVFTGALGWRSIFYIMAPTTLIPFFLALLFVKDEWADAKGEPYDVKGSILYALSLVLFMYGMTLLPKIRGLFFLIPGFIGLILFVRHELKITYPLFEVRLFKKNRLFAFSSVAALIHYGSTFAISFLMSLYLQVSLRISPQMTGIILATQPITQALLSPVTGKLSDKIEPAILVSTGMGTTAIGLFLLSLLTTGSTLLYVIPVLILLGSGYALFSSPNTNAIMSSVEKKHYGLASGTVATMRSLGMVLSMCVTTVVFAQFIGEREIGLKTIEAFGKSVQVSFVIFTVFCAVGIYFSAVRGKLGERKNR